jgi:hypothetical protein
MKIVAKRMGQDIFLISHDNELTEDSLGQMVDTTKNGKNGISPVKKVYSFIKDAYWEDYDGPLTAREVLQKYKQ